MRRIFFTLFLLILSNSGFAFVILLDESIQLWKREVTFDFNFSECNFPEGELEGVLDHAIKQWNSVAGTTLRLKKGGPVNFLADKIFQSYTTPQNALFTCMTDLTPIFPAGYSKNNMIGTGYGYLFTNGASVTSGYALFNLDLDTPGGVSMSKAFDLSRGKANTFIRHIAVHEIGHTLGFDHSGDANSVMNYKGKEILGQDDMDGVRYLYASSDQQFVGCSTIGAQRRGHHIDVTLLLLPFAALLLFKLSRQTRRKFSKAK